jgi:hypothetical protein
MIEVLSVEKQDSGAVIARISIKLHKCHGLIMEDVCILAKEKKRWVGFPSKKKIIDGQEKWIPYSHFEGDIQRKLCDEILKAYDAWGKPQ